MSDRILIVEDEKKLLDHLFQSFSDEGFSSFTCESFRELESLLDLPVKKFDLIVMDRLLQGKDSALLLGKIKERLPEAKVMVLSAINSSSEKAALLNAGADDYLAKPFDTQELMARVRAILRRSRSDLECGNVLLDSDNRLLKVGTQEVALTNKEFVLLRTLIETPGKIYGKTYLYESVWGVNVEVDSNAVEATVTKLRRRLEETGASIQIKNTRNLGYWIEK